jgi:hypothetical protein
MKRITSLLPLLLCVSCIGTDVGNPEDAPDEVLIDEGSADGTVSLTSLPLEDADDRDAQRAHTNRLITADGLDIKEAWVAVDSMRTCQRRVDKVDLCVRYKIGPAALNLLTGETLPKRVKAFSRAGTFDTVEFIYKQSPAAGARSGVDDLRDAALSIRGLDADGRAFHVTDDQGGAIVFEPQGGVQLQEGNNLFALQLDPGGWLSAAALRELDADPIIISRTVNIPLFAYFERAFQTTTELIYDEDHSGDMDDHEREHPLASGD